MEEPGKEPPTEGWGRFVFKALIDPEETLKEASDSAKSGSGVLKVVLVLVISAVVVAFFTWAKVVHPEWNLDEGR